MLAFLANFEHAVVVKILKRAPIRSIVDSRIACHAGHGQIEFKFIFEINRITYFPVISIARGNIPEIFWWPGWVMNHAHAHADVYVFTYPCSSSSAETNSD